MSRTSFSVHVFTCAASLIARATWTRGYLNLTRASSGHAVLPQSCLLCLPACLSERSTQAWSHPPEPSAHALQAVTPSWFCFFPCPCFVFRHGPCGHFPGGCSSLLSGSLRPHRPLSTALCCQSSVQHAHLTLAPPSLTRLHTGTKTKLCVEWRP